MPAFQVVVRYGVFSLFVLSALVALASWLVRTRRLSPFGPVGRALRGATEPVLRPVERRLVRLGPHRRVRRADPSSVAHHGNARLEPARGVAAALRARAHVARLRGSALIATLVVHVAPRARTTAVAGRHGDAIRIRVAAPPVDGAANAELVRFLAERLGVSRSAVAIAAGAAGRRKTVEIAGLATDAAVRAF